MKKLRKYSLSTSTAPFTTCSRKLSVKPTNQKFPDSICFQKNKMIFWMNSKRRIVNKTFWIKYICRRCHTISMVILKISSNRIRRYTSQLALITNYKRWPPVTYIKFCLWTSKESLDQWISFSKKKNLTIKIETKSFWSISSVRRYLSMIGHSRSFILRMWPLVCCMNRWKLLRIWKTW